jgi:hypothetical protein
VAKMDFSGDNYEKGFFYAVENLSKYNLSVYQAAKVNTLQKNVQLIKEKLENNDQPQAEVILMNILHLKYK